MYMYVHICMYSYGQRSGSQTIVKMAAYELPFEYAIKTGNIFAAATGHKSTTTKM